MKNLRINIYKENEMFLIELVWAKIRKKIMNLSSAACELRRQVYILPFWEETIYWRVIIDYSLMVDGQESCGEIVKGFIDAKARLLKNFFEHILYIFWIDIASLVNFWSKKSADVCNYWWNICRNRVANIADVFIDKSVYTKSLIAIYKIYILKISIVMLCQYKI